jgi:hypothetical protein
MTLPFTDFLAGLVKKRLTGEANAGGAKSFAFRRTYNNFRSAGSEEERSADRVHGIKLRMRIDMNAWAGRETADLYAAGSGQTRNAGPNLDSGLAIEHDPSWGMIACVFLPTRPSVNTAVHEPDRQIW